MKPASAAQQWQTALGAFTLARYPITTGDTRLAWASSDDLLLEEATRLGVPGHSILVVNDAHGALCVALQPHALWTDSSLSVLALRSNERANQCVQTPVVWSSEAPLPAGGAAVSLVVLKIPKQLPYLEYQLAQLAHLLPQGATVLAAGMDKHLSPHTASIIERFIGPTKRHPGKRKARLFSARMEIRPAIVNPSPATYFCESLGQTLHGLPNVFSREKLDLGSRLLLEQLPRLDPAEMLIDLACGNGVLGLTGFKLGLAQEVAFCDESAMAVQSAQRNATQCFPNDTQQFTFHQGDGLIDYRGKPADLILCNPPFHQEHAVDAFVGRRLLKQSRSALSPEGRICLVANRHLNYRAELQRRFRQVEQLAGNSRFNVFLAHNN